jgi:tetratricopeptide (TPR) repeat protein
MPAKGGDWNYGLMLFFAALAMASKSSTVILPIVLCLCAWWVEGRWHRRNLVRVAPVFLMTVAASALSVWTQHLEGANDLSSVRSGPERLVTAGRVVWFYLGKLAWPHPLIFIYPRWEIDAGRWLSYLPLAALMLALLVLWRRRASWGRPYFFALAYFLAALLPVLGLVDHYFLRYSFVGDHFQYLASMGPLALAGTGITTAFGFLKKAPRWLEPSFGGVLLLSLGVLTWRQCWMYQDEETLWRTTIARNPGCLMAYNNLGNVLQARGRISEAVEQYEAAISLNPDDAEARNNLGNALLQTGQLPEAMEQYEQALRIRPDYAAAHNNLGDTLLRTGRIPEAIDQYQQASRFNPDYAPMRYNLGNVLLQTGRLPEAIEQYEQCLRIEPDYPEAHNDLGSALGQTGRWQEAIAQFEQALQIKPDFAEAHYNLGNSLFQAGRVSEAIGQYQQALQIKPDYVEAHNNLGSALGQTGRMAEAREQFEEALRINPDFTAARNNLARAQALQKAPPAKQ